MFVTLLRTSLHDWIRNSNSNSLSFMSAACCVHFGLEKTNHCRAFKCLPSGPGYKIDLPPAPGTSSHALFSPPLMQIE